MKVDEYTKKARVYPAVLSLYLPLALLIGFALYNVKNFKALEIVCSTVSVLISSAVLTAAIRFWLGQVCRMVSKRLFQYPLFKEDESYMPTTDFLLWKDGTYPDSVKRDIHKKIRDMYGIKLSSKQAEFADEFLSRKLIVAAVQQIREDTRGDKMLLRYNIDFGFWRNLAGGCVLGCVISVVITVLDYFLPALPLRLPLVCMAVEFLLFFSAMFFLKCTARSYARQLITAFCALRAENSFLQILRARSMMLEPLKGRRLIDEISFS